MSELDVWGLIEKGCFAEASMLADTQFAETQNIFPLRNKIFALLNLGRYQDCLDLCVMIMELRKGECDNEFIFAGISSWLLGNREDAITFWIKAQGTLYKDAAGGVNSLILLLFAAIKIDNKRLIKSTRSKLKKLLKSKHSGAWPGPVAKFVLGEIGKDILLSMVSSVPYLRERHLCQASFAIALVNLENKNFEVYKIEMERCISYAPCAYLTSEFYIAQSETRN